MKIHSLFVVLVTFLMGFPAYGSECPVTVPAMKDPDELLKLWGQGAWHGSYDLAALMPEHGHWVGMGPERNYFDKFWWWRRGFDAHQEPNPELIISGSRLDGREPPILIENTTSAFGENWNLMLVGMEFPSPGCWEVLGTYHGHQLRFVVEVANS